MKKKKFLFLTFFFPNFLLNLHIIKLYQKAIQKKKKVRYKVCKINIEILPNCWILLQFHDSIRTLFRYVLWNWTRNAALKHTTGGVYGGVETIFRNRTAVVFIQIECKKKFSLMFGLAKTEEQTYSTVSCLLLRRNTRLD